MPQSAPAPDSTELKALRAEVSDQKKAIALLVSEKTALATQVEQIASLEAEAKTATTHFAESRSTVQRLEGRTMTLENERKDLEAEVDRLAKRNQDLQKAESYRGEVERLRKEKVELTSKVEELQEQLKEVDDKEGGKVKELEESLERLREREGLLEREVGKLKTVSFTIMSSSHLSVESTV